MSEGYNRIRYKISQMFHRWGILNEERRKSLIRFNNSLKSMLVPRPTRFLITAWDASTPVVHSATCIRGAETGSLLTPAAPSPTIDTTLSPVFRMALRRASPGAHADRL